MRNLKDTVLTAFFILHLCPIIASAGQTHRLQIQEDHVLPQSNITIQAGDTVIWESDVIDSQITLPATSEKEGFRLVAGFNKKAATDDFTAKLGKDKKARVEFLLTGIYTYRLEGLNPGRSALKCGVDVMPHSLVGRIIVSGSAP